MVNNTSKIDIKWITYQISTPVQIEKPFSKTHAPVLELILYENF